MEKLLHPRTLSRRTTIYIVTTCALFSAFFITNFFIPPLIPSAAAEGCGSITTLEGDIVEIINCTNPFGSSGSIPTFLYTLINGQRVTNNETVILSFPETESIETTFAEDPSRFSLYTQTQIGFQELDPEVVLPSEPDESDFEAVLRIFFPSYDDETIALYLNAAYGDDFDSLTEAQEDEVFNFLDNGSVEQLLYGSPTIKNLGVGTYVIQTVVPKPCLSNNTTNTVWSSLRTLIIPTAHAFDCGNDIYVLTFTLKEEISEPLGASSVLFLPGIQASRLYSGEDKLWEPRNNGSVESLAMTAAGESINSIFATEPIDTITVDTLFGYQFSGGDVYAGFMSFLDQLVSDDVIAQWYPYAYDWRYDVFEVVRDGTVTNAVGDKEYLKVVVEALANQSKSEKITVVAHSNGGLLIKALLIEYPELTDKVDKIIFVGTPHLGTPKAIGTILHGYDQDQGEGIIVSAKNARRVINNLPGAYGLLPSLNYLSQMGPFISFSNTASTELYRAVYETTIDSESEYEQFLQAAEFGTDRSLGDDIYIPAPANAALAQTAFEQHQVLDTWEAPANIEVSEIIGFGLPTLYTLIYRDENNESCDSTNVTGPIFPIFVCKNDTPPRVFGAFSAFGDATVVGESAEGYVGISNEFFVDLDTISIDNDLNNIPEIEHANITETIYIQNLIHQIILDEEAEKPQYIYDRPLFVQNYIIQQIASPVAIASFDAEGRVTGLVREGGEYVVKEEIPGSQYFEFGGVKYVVVPSGVIEDTVLSGYDFGSFSYYVDELSGENTTTAQTAIINVATSPSFVAEVVWEDGFPSELVVDANGDGESDYILGFDGTQTLLNQETVPVAKGSSATRVNTRTAAPQSTVAGIATTTAATSTQYVLTDDDIIILRERLALLLQLLLSIKNHVK